MAKDSKIKCLSSESYTPILHFSNLRSYSKYYLYPWNKQICIRCSMKFHYSVWRKKICDETKFAEFPHCAVHTVGWTLYVGYYKSKNSWNQFTGWFIKKSVSRNFCFLKICICAKSFLMTCHESYEISTVLIIIVATLN